MKRFAIIALAVFVSACGFQPMYGGGPSSSGVLFQSINVIDNSASGRTGYLLEDALRQRLTASNAPDRTADLSIWSTEQSSGLGIQANDAASRSDLYLTVSYRLDQRDAVGNPMKPITGTLTSVATYNIATSPYAEITALADARKRAAEDISERIARDILFKDKK